MSQAACPFVWYELMTTDDRAAEAFYSQVVGWKTSDAGMPGMRYTLLSAGDTHVGGLMALPKEALAGGAQPGWMGYVGVADVDAYAAKVEQAGGKVCHGPEDIPGVGRFASVTDPHGAVFCLFQGKDGDHAPEHAPGTIGTVGWHELSAGALDPAWDFYSGLFGWTKDEAMDMGPGGLYQLFKAGGAPIGGMLTKPAEMPAPAWLYYFCVDAIDAAVARATAAGGKLHSGPMEVPGGDWIAHCSDPQGAMFAMVAPAR